MKKRANHILMFKLVIGKMIFHTHYFEWFQNKALPKKINLGNQSIRLDFDF
jgi:hypothetical protein